MSLYVDPDGWDIGLAEWANILEYERPWYTSWVGEVQVITTYHGMREELGQVWLGLKPWGTAINTSGTFAEIELYQNREEAQDRHWAHVDAVREGFHCALCREGTADEYSEHD